MDNRIVLISSSPLVVSQARQLFAQKGYEYPVIEADFDRAQELAAQAVEKGAKVFISRGHSANLVSRFNLPVVPLRFTYYDFFTAIKEARKISDKIAIVGYRTSLFHTVEMYKENLSNPLTVHLDTPDQLDSTMRRLRGQGIEVVIGGAATSDLAEKYGMKAILIGLEDNSILDALSEAQALLHMELQHSAHIATVDAILNSATESIIALNRRGVITDANDSAKKLLGKDCLEKNAGRYMGEGVVQALNRGTGFNRELYTVNQVLCTVNATPLRDGLTDRLGVVTFQPVKQVQSLEQTIRKKQADSGNVAKNHFENIIGQSPALVDTIRTARRFAASHSTVLISGETGTGKEMFAQSIHNASPRANGPFVAINCAALPQNILESELFGYVKGAFTGASAEGRAGYFEMAHTGTIFLDEIGEIPLDIQVKLLRVLQEKEIRRIGDRKVFRVDTRVIAATNKDLYKLVEEGKFREDLYYRLAVLTFTLPPLRRRKGDITLIARDILKEISQRDGRPVRGFTPEAEAFLESQEWKGNVRQLHNAVERALILSDEEYLDRPLLLQAMGLSEAPTPALPRPKPVSALAKEKIAAALQEERGNRERTALRLGISKTTLWRRLREIEKEDPGYLDGILLR